MASVTLMLKDNKANEKGEIPVYIRIIKGRKAKFISLGIKVRTDQWNEQKLRVKSSYPNSARINAKIAQKVADAEAVAITMETKQNFVTSKKIKEAVLGKDAVSLIRYAKQFQADLKAKGQIGTHNRVKTVITKLTDYTKTTDFNFDDFDLQFLKKYERYLRDEKKNSQNTIHANLKLFRTLFNSAVREELIGPELNPFTKFKMSTTSTTKEYLTEDELQAFEQLELKAGSVMYHHKSMYVFAAYAGGLRISDLLQLRWQNFDGTHIKVITQKTKEAIPIRLPSKALEILEVYATAYPEKKPADFIFPLLSNSLDTTDAALLFQAISRSTAYANKNLKVLAQKAEIDKAISFHSSRHTWATRALRKGMRIEYVSKLMGHTNIRTTQVYTKIVNEDLDAAMDVFN
jgi:integrase/recombinase XerD